MKEFTIDQRLDQIMNILEDTFEDSVKAVFLEGADPEHVGQIIDALKLGVLAALSREEAVLWKERMDARIEAVNGMTEDELFGMSGLRF